MFAVIETGGKQYLVKTGDKIQVEKLSVKEGESVNFDKVLLTSDGSTAQVGKPYLKGATVSGKVLKQARAKTVKVLKFKPKSKYRRKSGNRQHYTEIEITKI